MVDTVPPSEAAVAIAYDHALECMEQLCEDVNVRRPISSTMVFVTVDRLLAAMRMNAPRLIGLTARPSTSNFLCGHSVNTSILAMVTGRGLGYQASQLRDVGAAGLLHDVGLIRLMPVLGARSVPYHDVYGHTAETLALLEHDADLSRIRVYLDAADRPSRAAQPSTEDEHMLRTIIRLTDLYDSLTHSRAERPTPIVFAAVRSILRAQHLFDPQVVRTFFDQVGIYPLGTWVQLNTGEAGRVTMVKEGLPLRPQVTVVYDRFGSRLAQEKVIELDRDPIFFVKESLAGEPSRS